MADTPDSASAPTPASEPLAKAPGAGMTVGQKIRLALVGLVALLLIIFLASNWNDVQVRFFGFTPSLPMAVWLCSGVGGGFVLGWTVNALRGRKSSKS